MTGSTPTPWDPHLSDQRPRPLQDLSFDRRSEHVGFGSQTAADTLWWRLQNPWKADHGYCDSISQNANPASTFKLSQCILFMCLFSPPVGMTPKKHTNNILTLTQSQDNPPNLLCLCFLSLNLLIGTRKGRYEQITQNIWNPPGRPGVPGTPGRCPGKDAFFCQSFYVEQQEIPWSPAGRPFFLSHRVSQGHLAGVPRFFLSLCTSSFLINKRVMPGSTTTTVWIWR